MTTISDYLNDLRIAVTNIVENTDDEPQAKILDIDRAFEEAEDSIKDLVERII